MLFIQWKKQKDVPIAFPGNEIPDPIPESKQIAAGYPITLTFPITAKIKNASGTLKLDGKSLPIWFSSPEKPANPQYPYYQGSTINIIAHDVLKPKSTYEVEVSATVNGKAWSKRWTFTTISREKLVEDQVKTVFEKINYYRKKAGAVPLTLNPDLTKAAQAHADYLSINDLKDLQRTIRYSQRRSELTGVHKRRGKGGGLLTRGSSPHLMRLPCWIVGWHRFTIVLLFWNLLFGTVV